MSELKDKGYNEKRYIPDTKVIQIDPLGAALDKAGHEGGAGKSLRKKSNDVVAIIVSCSCFNHKNCTWIKLNSKFIINSQNYFALL